MEPEMEPEMKSSITCRGLLLAMAVLCGLQQFARGGAIDIPMQSAKANAEADAFTAQADDPSAIFYNPAGLTQLHGTQFSAGALYLQPIFHFQGDDGSNERMNLPTVIPHLYAESDFGLDRFRFGLGVNAEDGINEDWGTSGPLNTIVTKAQLSVIAISPTVAYRVDDHLSLGMAFNIYYGDLDLERNVVLAAPPAPEGRFRLYGNGFSYGVTPGIMYKFDSRNQIGAYYRSPYTIDFGGRARVASTIIPEIGPSVAHEKLNFPQSCGVGYAMRPLDPLTLEADVIWTDWNTTDKLKISSPNPAFNGQTLPANWESGFTFRAGVQYQLNPNWALRCGYAYGQDAVPQSTFSPIVPDSNYHLGAMGVGYSTEHWGLDLATMFIYREERHIHNSVNSPTVDGTWNNQFYGLMLTFTVRL
jgi:long-chain fatty acid transport protein